MLSRDPKYLEITKFEELNGLVVEVKKMLSSLIITFEGNRPILSPRWKADS